MFQKIIFLLVFTFAVFTRAEDTISISNIKISAAGANAAATRAIAIEKGQIKAFSELVKLHFPKALNKAATINSAKILNTVESFELSDEKRSATNYFAKMSVIFNKSQVETLMKTFNADYVENTPIKQQDPISLEVDEAPAMDSLIVPIYEKNGQVYWLDDESPWYNLWQEKLKLANSNKFVLPIGDLEDLSLLNKDTLSKNLIDLSVLLERYNINNIALLKLKIIEDNTASLSIDYINRFHRSWQHHNFAEISDIDINHIINKYYNEAINFKFNSNQSFAESLQNTDPKTILVSFPIRKISDWEDLEQTLASFKFISIEIKEVSLENYSFNLTYSVDFNKLEHILHENNLFLKPQGKNHYIMEH